MVLAALDAGVARFEYQPASALDASDPNCAAVPLSICLCDNALDFDVATPFEQPLGGSQSAMSYLAIALARRGHQVTVLSRTTRPRTVMGVECLHIKSIREGFFESRRYDAVIPSNNPADFTDLRLRLPAQTVLALWNHHAIDQPAIQELSRRNVRKKWDRIICISEWQRRATVEAFRLEPERTVVLRNAISPPFENLFASPRDVVAAKAAHPVLVYTSTPFRGLDALLDVFAMLHTQHPDAALEIYSSLGVYQADPRSDPNAPLYDRARALPSTTYVGSISQTALASALRRATHFSYPNTFAETSCISVMEAMAAGLFVTTSALGALPETTIGFADLVVPPAGAGDLPRFRMAFMSRLHAALEDHARQPAAFAERRFAQIEAINRGYTWAVRAAEWEAEISTWVAERVQRSLARSPFDSDAI